MSEDNKQADERSSGLLGFWQELKQRKVVQMGISYAVIGWLIMEVSDTVLPYLGVAESLIGAVVIVVIIGFPIILVLAWIYELTPEGIRVTNTDGRSIGRVGLLTAAIIPTILFGVLAVRFIYQTKTTTDEITFVSQAQFEELTENSIAVLPLENLSLDEADSFLAAGLHNELTAVVSKIRELKTISRSSTTRYRETTKTHQTIAAELGVKNLLTGAVQRIGENIRINVQLIDPERGQSVWGESFVREFAPDNLFAIQAEISQAIALELSIMLSPEESANIAKVPTQNLDAFEAYVKGQEFLLENNMTFMPQAADLFKDAVSLDPQFTLAYVGLARSYLRGYARVFGMTSEERDQLLQDAVDKAVALDPVLPEVLVLRGRMLSRKKSYKEADQLLRRAVELAPNLAEAHFHVGMNLRSELGRENGEESLARWGVETLSEVIPLQNHALLPWFNKAVELEPADPTYRERLAYLYGDMIDERENEIAQYRQAIAFNPNYGYVYRLLAIRLRQFGQYDEAIVNFRKAIALDPESLEPYVGIKVDYQAIGADEEVDFWDKQFDRFRSVPKAEREPTLWDRANEYRRQGKDAEALSVYREIVATENFIKMGSSARRAVLFDDLRGGNLVEARARYFAELPNLFDPEVSIVEESDRIGHPEDFCALAVEIAPILMALGETKQAEILLDEVWSLYKGNPRPFGKEKMEILISCIRGDAERAIEVLQGLVDQGFCGQDFLLDARLDAIRDDPRFIAIENVVDERLAQQLVNVRRMEANGELAAIPEWPVK